MITVCFQLYAKGCRILAIAGKNIYKVERDGEKTGRKKAEMDFWLIGRTQLMTERERKEGATQRAEVENNRTKDK